MVTMSTRATCPAPRTAYSPCVAADFRAWMAQQRMSPSALAGEGRGEGAARRRFAAEQLWWPAKMSEHIAPNLGLEAEDFESSTFNQRGGLVKVHQLFGAKLPKVISSLNETLAA